MARRSSVCMKSPALAWCRRPRPRNRSPETKAVHRNALAAPATQQASAQPSNIIMYNAAGLSIVFGPDAGVNLSSLTQNEQKMSQFAARVMPNNNSITAEAQNYGDEGLKQAFLAR